MGKRSAFPFRKRVWATLAQVAGLIGTAYIVWNGSIVLRLRHESFASIAADALLYSVVAWACSATLSLILCAAFLGWDAESALRMSLRTSRTAVWFAPACILIAHASRAALIPALALVIGATQLLYAQWTAMQPKGAGSVELPGFFEPLPSPSLFRVLGPALWTAFLFQGAVTAQVGKRPLLSAAMFCVGFAMLTLLMLMGGALEADRKQSLPRAAFGVLLTLILAAAITAVHIYARYPHGRGGDEMARGPVESIRELMRNLFPHDTGNRDTGEESGRRYNPPGAADDGKTVFPGIVLEPEVNPYTTLVAPTPKWLKSSVANLADQPYGIPFSGEYWMFRPPYRRPPAGAHHQRGNPAKLSFKTNDNSRMNMEAHQRLDRVIDTACCEAIRVAITNADQYPGTIQLELFLGRQRAGGGVESELSLGTVPVGRWPRDSLLDADPRPVPDVLEFRMPQPAPLPKFDEMHVVIHRDPVRGERSARLSIDRFILAPGRK